MLSYQHIYHAGNWADVHKHWILAALLTQLKQKPKPISYFETHSGRGFYNLNAQEARKTAEAQHAVLSPAVENAISKSAYGQILESYRKRFGPAAYAGSPLIAQSILDAQDQMHFSELHPGEFEHLKKAIGKSSPKLYLKNGFEMVHSLIPPTPRRGIVFVDPSYEIKTDYEEIPKFFRTCARKWNVGLFALWYPILENGAHQAMLTTLMAQFPQALRHEISFTPHSAKYKMIGSGFFLSKTPFGFDQKITEINRFFDRV